MTTSVSVFTFMISIIIIVILVSVQYTLNMILRELKSIRIRLGADPENYRAEQRGRDGYNYKSEKNTVNNHE